MTLPSEITKDEDVIDSRDVIKRIEHLQDLLEDADDDEKKQDFEDEYREELDALLAVQKQGESSPDWHHGEALIRDSYFTDYIEQLVYDCYELPKGFGSNTWPWCHMKMDWEAAAEAAKADYFDVNFDGVTYWIRG